MSQHIFALILSIGVAWVVASLLFESLNSDPPGFLFRLTRKKPKTPKRRHNDRR